MSVDVLSAQALNRATLARQMLLPAPVRFLPEYDNALLGYRDRTRMIGDVRRRLVDPGIPGSFRTVLVDGRVGGSWRVERESATSTIEPVVRLTKHETSDLTDEGVRLLALLAPDDGSRDVRVVRPVAGSRTA